MVSPAQRAASERLLDEDIAANRLRRRQADWNLVFEEAIRLSREFTAETLARSLDILHVAAAVTEGADPFFTADERQAAVARRAGLRTETLE